MSLPPLRVALPASSDGPPSAPLSSRSPRQTLSPPRSSRSPRPRLADAEHVNVGINAARERFLRASTPGTPGPHARSRSPSLREQVLSHAPTLIFANGFWGKPAERERFIAVALNCAHEFLASGLPITPTSQQQPRGLPAELERRYDALLGPAWRCVVGIRTVSAAMDGVSSHPFHPHIHFQIGGTPFLLFQEQFHELFRVLNKGGGQKLRDEPDPGDACLCARADGLYKTQAYIDDPSVGDTGLYVSMKLHGWSEPPPESPFGAVAHPLGN